VFNRGESTDYRHVFSFSPSQGLAIALSQYAPGKDVWIAGKRYQSGAIYSPITSDTQNMWQSRKLYFECGYCEYGETFELSEAEKGEIRNCPACGQTDSFGPAKYWIEPPGFAHPVDVEPDHARDDLPEKSRATRAKLLAPTPSSDAQWVNITNSIKLHYLRKPLLVTNSGPKNEGYNYCTYCKRIEPTAGFIHTLHKTHQKPYPSERDPSCDGHYSKGVVLGTDFLTDVLLVSFSVKEPVTLKPGLLGTFVALRTISEALNIAACERLELESREIGAEFRPALTPAGIEGKEAEIFLYDLLPGGGGFTRQLGEIGRPVFERALQILEECPENCDRSCYKCLRSYRNKFEHHRLDRYLGASLLRYLMSGDVPSLAPDRIVASTEVLFSDLVNHKPDGIQFTRDESILVPGLGDITIPISAKLDSGRTFALAITNPLTPDYHPSEELRALSELSPTIVVKFIDDLQIRQNLPRTTLDILGLLTDE